VVGCDTPPMPGCWNRHWAPNQHLPACQYLGAGGQAQNVRGHGDWAVMKKTGPRLLREQCRIRSPRHRLCIANIGLWSVDCGHCLRKNKNNARAFSETAEWRR